MSQLSLSCSLSSPSVFCCFSLYLAQCCNLILFTGPLNWKKPTVTSRLLRVVLKLTVQTNKIVAVSPYSPVFFFASSYFVCQNSQVKVDGYYLKLDNDDFLTLSDSLLTNNPIFLHCTTVGIYCH